MRIYRGHHSRSPVVDGEVIMGSGAMRRDEEDYGTIGNDGTDGNDPGSDSFRLFRLFRLFRNLS